MNSITLPASKSIGARMLMTSYFAGSLRQAPRLDDCDDLKVIQAALRNLENNAMHHGAAQAVLDIHASGTAFRFVTAAASSTPDANVIVTGTPRLCSRPMTPLLGVLRQAGAEICAQGDNGTGPYDILGHRLHGGDYEIRGDVSSQFISALMLAAPTWEGGMRLRFTTPLVSRPYAEMTARVMWRFGVEATLTDEGVAVPQSDYESPAEFRVEADWSAAGFFYEASLLGVRENELKINGLVSPSLSLQGDAATANVFASLGVLSVFDNAGATLIREEGSADSIDISLADTPDLAPALAVACCLNGTKFRFSGVHHLRIKECDRLTVMQTELARLGFALTVGEDTLTWDGAMTAPESDPLILTYDDHRIAMSFAMAALKLGRIRIQHPEVVDKSFATFWSELPKLGLACTEQDGIMTVTLKNQAK